MPLLRYSSTYSHSKSSECPFWSANACSTVPSSPPVSTAPTFKAHCSTFLSFSWSLLMPGDALTASRANWCSLSFFIWTLLYDCFARVMMTPCSETLVSKNCSCFELKNYSCCPLYCLANDSDPDQARPKITHFTCCFSYLHCLIPFCLINSSAASQATWSAPVRTVAQNPPHPKRTSFLLVVAILSASFFDSLSTNLNSCLHFPALKILSRCSKCTSSFFLLFRSVLASLWSVSQTFMMISRWGFQSSRFWPFWSDCSQNHNFCSKKMKRCLANCCCDCFVQCQRSQRLFYCFSLWASTQELSAKDKFGVWWWSSFRWHFQAKASETFPTKSKLSKCNTTW